MALDGIYWDFGFYKSRLTCGKGLSRVLGFGIDDVELGSKASICRDVACLRGVGYDRLLRCSWQLTVYFRPQAPTGLPFRP